MKPKLILDLDNTLIHTVPARVPATQPYHKYGYHFIYQRDHLREFIDFAFKYYDVAFWTAATRDYALHVIFNVVLAGTDYKPEFILSREHTRMSTAKYGTSKDLRLVYEKYGRIGYNPCTTTIVDDYEEVYRGNPRNTIRVKKFLVNVDASHDDTLLHAMNTLYNQFNKRTHK